MDQRDGLPSANPGVILVTIEDLSESRMSMIAGLFLLLVLFVFVLVLAKNAQGPYPNEFSIGGYMVRFSSVDKLCYAVALASVVLALLAALTLLWGPKDQEVIGKLLATGGILFGAALLVLVLNRLMRGKES